MVLPKVPGGDEYLWAGLPSGVTNGFTSSDECDARALDDVTNDLLALDAKRRVFTLNMFGGDVVGVYTLKKFMIENWKMMSGNWLVESCERE